MEMASIPYGVAVTVPFDLFNNSYQLLTDSVAGDLEEGDIRYSVDGGAYVDLPAENIGKVAGGPFTFTLSSLVTEAKTIRVTLHDSGAAEPNARLFSEIVWLFTTYGNASAQYPLLPLQPASQSGLSALALETSVGAVETKVDNVQVDLTTMDGKVDGIQTGVTTIDGKVDGIQTGVTTIDGKVDGIQTGVTTIDGKVDNVQTDVTTIDGKVDNVQTDVTTIAAAVAALNDIAVADIMDAVIEDVYTLKGTLSLVAAALVGKSTNNGLSFIGLDGSTVRVVATVDDNSNRTAVVLTPVV